MKMSEKFKNKAESKIFRRRSHSYVEERFYLTTMLLDFAAICNKNNCIYVNIFRKFFQGSFELNFNKPVVHFDKIRQFE